MGFFTGLPKLHTGYNEKKTYVDRFSKRPLFVPSKATDEAVTVAGQVHDLEFRLHGISQAVEIRDVNLCPSSATTASGGLYGRR